MTKESKEIKEIKKVQQWVYKTHYPQKVVVRPTMTTGVYNAQGMIVPGSQMKLNPIILNFVANHVFVNEAFAKQNKIKLGDLIALIEAEPKYGVNFWCISSPEKVMTEKQKKDSEKSPPKPKVIQGTRK